MKSILLALIIIVFFSLITISTEMYIDYLNYNDVPVSLKAIFVDGEGGVLVGAIVVLATLILFYHKFKWENDFLYLLSSMTFKKVSKVFNSTKEKMKKELEDE